MTEVKQYLDLITEIWNSVILENEYVQSKLNFNEKKRSNYFGEIMHYFNDTFAVVDRHESIKTNSCEFDEYVFYNIGFLQTLYVHQDLTDEMLNIFSLISSEYVDRKQIRELRNELVGHPISKDPKTGKLISSVFWIGNPPLSGKNKLDFSRIQYQKYEEGKWDNTERISIEIDYLIQLHKKYLIKYFAKILRKEKKVISDLRKKLECILNLYKVENKNINKIIKLSKIYVYNKFSDSGTFDFVYLEEAINKKDDGNRYGYYIEHCLNKIHENIDDMLDEIQKNNKGIDKLLSCGNAEKISLETKDKETHFITDPVTSSSDIKSSNIIDTNEIKNNSMYIYSFSKLAEQKYMYLIDILIQEQHANIELVSELNNMKISYENEDDFEYYLSYIYISKLLQ